jgi:uncharacterized protein YndB with AHSA1/START domain
MNTSEIIKTIFLPVSAKVAWGYLTKADKLAKWFHAPKQGLEDGQDYELFGTESGDKLCWGKVLNMEPYTSLAYSFAVKPFPDMQTEVHWKLDEIEGGTRITMRHTGLDSAGAESFGLSMALDRGWDGHFAKLREV